MENNYNNDKSSIDDLNDSDILSDEALWDLLDDFTNDKIENKEKMTEIIDNEKKCLSCNSNNIIFSENRNRFICTKCGSVCDEIFEEKPDWNNDENKKDVGRNGIPINTFFPNTSLGTTINYSGFSKIKMLHSWRQMPYKERSLAQVLTNIENKCKKYKITKAVIDNAKILYRNIRDSKHQTGKNKGKYIIIRGKNRIQIIAACVYFGAKLQNCTRSNKEIADIFNLEIKQVTKGCRKFLEYMQNNLILYDIKPSQGTDYIYRNGAKLGLEKEVLDLANVICKNTAILNIATNHQPESIAAASIILAVNKLKKKIVKKNILNEFQISEVTINKTCNSILQYTNIITDNELTNKINNKMINKLDNIIQSKITNNEDYIDFDNLSFNNKYNIIDYDIIDNNNKEIIFDHNFDINNVIDDKNILVEKKKRGRKPKNKNIDNDDNNFMSNFFTSSIDNTDSINSNITETTETTETTDSINTTESSENKNIKKRGRPRKIIIENNSTN
jgi:transcription initiation factor TFIIIB Brf1 subunit/transcription initiation factor TFIIB